MIESTRREYYGAMKTSRRWIKCSLKLWRQLKQVRKNQGCSNTTFKLIVRTTTPADDGGGGGSEMQVWQNEIDRQLEEQRQRFQQLCRQEEQRFERAIGEWKHKRKQVNICASFFIAN